VEQTGADLELADYSLPVAVIVPVVVGVLALAVAAWRLASQDID
jgi:hypothetical protein